MSRLIRILNLFEGCRKPMDGDEPYSTPWIPLSGAGWSRVALATGVLTSSGGATLEFDALDDDGIARWHCAHEVGSVGSQRVEDLAFHRGQTVRGRLLRQTGGLSLSAFLELWDDTEIPEAS